PFSSGSSSCRLRLRERGQFRLGAAGRIALGGPPGMTVRIVPRNRLLLPARQPLLRHSGSLLHSAAADKVGVGLIGRLLRLGASGEITNGWYLLCGLWFRVAR